MVLWKKYNNGSGLWICLFSFSLFQDANTGTSESDAGWWNNLALLSNIQNRAPHRLPRWTLEWEKRAWTFRSFGTPKWIDSNLWNLRCHYVQWTAFSSYLCIYVLQILGRHVMNTVNNFNCGLMAGHKGQGLPLWQQFRDCACRSAKVVCDGTMTWT